MFWNPYYIPSSIKQSAEYLFFTEMEASSESAGVIDECIEKNINVGFKLKAPSSIFVIDNFHFILYLALIILRTCCEEGS